MTEIPRDPHQAPIIQKSGEKPSGVIPRNAQNWAIVGIAILMAIIIAFSGRGGPKEKPSGNAPAVPLPVDPSKERIQEYRVQLDEQVRRLGEEQAKLAKSKQELAATPLAGGTPSGAYSIAAAPERNALREEKEKREYESLFASNIALTTREKQRNGETTEDFLSSSNNGAAGIKTGSTTGTARGPERPTPRAAQVVQYPIYEGTVIETALTNRLDGDFSGPVNCLVTTAVYSKDRMHLLIPQGSRMLGEVQRVETFGQTRLAVTFHRLLLPNGAEFSLNQFRGLNQVGETGLKDQVNRHYLQVFGVSLAIGAIGGFSQLNTQVGAGSSGEDAYRQGVASSVSQSALRILDRYLNILPTVTIREGQRVKVYLASDLALPEYEPMPEGGTDDSVASPLHF